MAFVGLHVVQAYAGGTGGNKTVQSLITNPTWSETLEIPGVTTQEASHGTATGRPIFRFRSEVDAYVSVGPEPDAENGTRYAVPANTDYDVFANPGDKVAWTTA